MALSRFSGQYRATAFNYGGSDTENPDPLVVCAGSNAASSAGTLTVQNGFFACADGTVVTPFNVNAPVTIVNALGADTQTPSAVSTNVQSNIYGPTATVSATTWTYAHTPGDRVSSGTVGLQEAINYASLKGGGTVLVDASWVTQGGTQAMLSAATVPSGVSILDNRTGGSAPVQTVQVALTLSQLQNAYTTPIQIIPAPGAGNLIDVIDAVLDLQYGSAAFTSGGAAQLSYGTALTYPASATIATTVFTSFSANQAIKVAGALAVTASANILNTAVYYSNATQTFAGGTAGSAILAVNYRVLTGLK